MCPGSAVVVNMTTNNVLAVRLARAEIRTSRANRAAEIRTARAAEIDNLSTLAEIGATFAPPAPIDPERCTSCPRTLAAIEIRLGDHLGRCLECSHRDYAAADRLNLAEILAETIA